MSTRPIHNLEDNVFVYMVTPLDRTKPIELGSVIIDIATNKINAAFKMTVGKTGKPLMEDGAYHIEARDSDAIIALPALLRKHGLKAICPTF